MATTATATDTTKTTEKSEPNLSEFVGNKIPDARCRTHLIAFLKDRALQDNIKTLKTERDAKGTAKARVAELTEEITKLEADNIRISSNTPMATAIVWDAAAEELIRHSLDQTILDDKKTVNIKYARSGDTSELIYFPFYSFLDEWQNVNDDDEYGVDKTKMEKEEHSFYTYIEKIFNHVKSEPKYANLSMRATSNLRIYISKLIIAGIEHQSQIAKILICDVVGARTVNVNHIEATVKILLTIGGKSANQIDEAIKNMTDKIELFQTEKKARAQRRLDDLSDEDKAKLEASREAAHQKQLEKAVEAKTTRARALVEEVKKAEAELKTSAKASAVASKAASPAKVSPPASKARPSKK